MYAFDTQSQHSRVSLAESTRAKELGPMRIIFPVIDSIHAQWPQFVSWTSLVVEQVQLLALILAPIYPWGPIIHGIGIPVYFAILPVWDARYYIYLEHNHSTIFAWIAALLTSLICAILAYRAYNVIRRKKIYVTMVSKVLIHGVASALFLPCLHVLLSMCVCATSSTDGLLWMARFPEQRCFSADVYWYIMFVVSIVIMALLFTIKYIMVSCIYDDHPLTISTRGRSQSLPERVLLLGQVLLAVLFHYLTEIGQLQTFSGIYCAVAFICAIFHAFCLPFFDHRVNQLRTVSLLQASYVGLIMTIRIELPSSPVSSTSSNWDSAVVFIGGFLVGVIGLQISNWRLSRRCLFDLRRAMHGEISYRSIRGAAFPSYLPVGERMAQMQLSILMSEHMQRVHRRGLEGESPKAAEAPAEASPIVILTPYLDAIYVVSDVEVSTRFVSLFSRIMKEAPTPEMISFATRIYLKGLTRFSRNHWLQVQLATFMCASTQHSSSVALAMMEGLRQHEGSFTLTYRILHRIASISSQSFVYESKVTGMMSEAQMYHKESLVNICLFWRRLLLYQSEIGHMTKLSNIITVQCTAGRESYLRLIAEDKDPYSMIRYAQFLEQVLMNSEAAMSIRESVVTAMDPSTDPTAMDSVRDTILAQQRNSKESSSRVVMKLRIQVTTVFIILLLDIIGFFVFASLMYHEALTAIRTVESAGRMRAMEANLGWRSVLLTQQSPPVGAAVWTEVQSDLTTYRELAKWLTYDRYKSLYSKVVQYATLPLKTIWYPPTSDLHSKGAGMWLFSEVGQSLWETVLSSTASSESRVDALQTIIINTGYTSPFMNNNTLQAYQEEAKHVLTTGRNVLIGLYVLSITLLVLNYVLVKYHLTLITNAKLSAFMLFTLIPKNALEELVKKCTNAIENLNKPDELFNEMCNAFQILDESAVESVMSPLESEEASTRGSQRAPNDEDSLDHLGNFAFVIKNANVADIGRMKMHPGQYETPYQKNAFIAPKPSAEEARERQWRIDDIEIEENLDEIRKEREMGQEKGVVGSEKGTMRETGRRGPTKNTAAVFYTVVVLGVSFALVVGSLLLYAITLTSSGSVDVVDFLAQIVRVQQSFNTERNYVEAMVYGANSAPLQSYLSLRSVTPFLRLGTLEVQLHGLADSYRQFDTWFRLFRRQTEAAVTLACLSASLNCTELDYITWSRADFQPPNNLFVRLDQSKPLPTSRNYDTSMNGPTKLMQLAQNVLSSPYYELVLQFCVSALEGIQMSTVKWMDGTLRKNLQLAHIVVTVAFSFACALLLLALAAAIKYHKHFKSQPMVNLLLLLWILVAVTLVSLCALLMPHRLTVQDVNDKASLLLMGVNKTYALSENLHTNAVSLVFRADPLGAVKISLATGTLQLDLAWTAFTNKLSVSRVDRSIAAYTKLRTAAQVDMILATLGCSLWNIPMPPVLMNLMWDIDKEVSGPIAILEFQGQQFYTNRVADLALGADEKRTLAQHLAFGPYRSTVAHLGATETLDVALDEVQGSRHQAKKNMNNVIAVATSAAAVALAAALVAIVIGLWVVLASMRVTDGTYEAGGQETRVRDTLFSTLINRTIIALLCVGGLFTMIFILAVLFVQMRMDFSVAQQAASLRESSTILSFMFMEFTPYFPWLLQLSIAYARDALQAAIDWYLATVGNSAHFSTMQFTLGPSTLENKMYNPDYVRNTATFTLSEIPQVIVGAVETSQRRWLTRVMETKVLPKSLQLAQVANLHDEMLQLLENINISTAMFSNDLSSDMEMLFIFFFVFSGITALAYCIVVFCVFIPMVRKVTREEEGTRMLLKLIPLNVRDSVPAIAEYLETGVVHRDTRIFEVDEAAADVSITPTITIDAHGTILKFSRAAEEMLLWTKSEALGQNVKIIVPDNIALEHDKYLLNYMKTGKRHILGTAVSVRAKRKDGTTLPVELFVREIRDSRKTTFIGTLRNRVDEIEFERAIGLSKALSQASTVPIVVIDNKGIIQQFSFAAGYTFKCTPREMIGLKVNVLMPQAEADVHDKHLERYHQTGIRRVIGSSRHIKAKKLTGELFPARLTVHELKRAGESIFIGYIEDMTQRLHLEMVAQASEVTMALSPIPLIMADEAGLITYCSDSAARTFGYSISEMMRRSIKILMPDAIAARHDAYVQAYNRNEKKRNTDVKLVTEGKRREDDGSFMTFPCEIMVKSIQTPGKGVIFVSFITDLTKKHVLETKRRIAESTIARSTVPIVFIDSKGQIENYNEAAESCFGYPSSDVIGKDVQLLFDESAGADNLIKDILEGFFHTGNRSNFGTAKKTVGKGSQGRQFPMEVTVWDVKVQSLYTFVIFIRSTLDDLKLIEANTHNEAIMRVATTPVVGASLDSTILFASDSACERFGWSREQLIGQKLGVLMTEESSVQHVEYVKNYARNLSLNSLSREQKQASREIRVLARSRDEQLFPAGVTIRDVHIDGIEPFLVAYIRDLTSEIALTTQRSISSAIVQLSNVPIIGITTEGAVTLFSSAAERATGYEAREVVGQNVKLLMSDDIAARHDGYLRAYTKTRVRTIIDRPRQVKVKKKDGTLFEVELMVKEITCGGSSEYIGFLRELTDEIILKQTMRVNAVVEDLVAVPLVVADESGKIIRCNANVEGEFLYSSTEVVGNHVSIFIPEDVSGQEGWLKSMLAEAREKLRNSTDGNHADGSKDSIGGSPRVAHNEVPREGLRIVKWMRARRKDGKEFLCEVSIGEALIQGMRGKKLVLYFRNVDLNVQLRVEHCITTSIVNVSPSPLVCIDSSGTVLMFSRAAEEAFGFRSSEVVGKNVKLLMTESVAKKHDSYLQRYLHTGIKTIIDKPPRRVVGQRKNGTTFPVELSVKEMKDNDGRTVFIGYLRDCLSEVAAAAEAAFSECIIEYSPLSIICTDSTGTVRQFSNEAEVLLRYRRRDIIGKSVAAISARIMAPADAAEVHDAGWTEQARGGMNSFPTSAQLSTRSENTSFSSASISSATTDLPSIGKLQVPLDADLRSGGGDFFAVNMKLSGGRTPLLVENICITKGDGTTVLCSVIIREIMTNPKALPRYVAYIKPIEEDLRNEGNLTKVNALMDALPAPVIVISVRGTILDASHHAEEMFEYTITELKEMRLRALMPRSVATQQMNELMREVKDLVSRGMRRDSAEAPPVSLQLVMCNKRGKESLKHLSIGGAYSPHTEEPYFVIYVEDISVQAELEQQQVMSHLIETQAAIATITTDPAGVITALSVTAEEWIGYSSAEVVGKHVTFLLPTGSSDPDTTDGLTAGAAGEAVLATSPQQPSVGAMAEVKSDFRAGTDNSPRGFPFMVEADNATGPMEPSHSIGAIVRRKHNSVTSVAMRKVALTNGDGGVAFYVFLLQVSGSSFSASLDVLGASVMDLAPTAMLLASVGGTIERVNQALLQMFMIPHGVIIVGCTTSILLQEQYAAAHDQLLLDARSTGVYSVLQRPRSLEGIDFTTKQVFQLEVSIELVKVEGGEQKLLFFLKRMDAEQQFATIRKINTAALELSLDATIVMTTDCTITMFSSVAETVFQASSSSLVGKNISLLLRDNHASDLNNLLTLFFRTRSHEVLEKPRIVHCRSQKYGTFFDAQMIVRELKLTTSNKSSFVVYFTTREGR